MFFSLIHSAVVQLLFLFFMTDVHIIMFLLEAHQDYSVALTLKVINKKINQVQITLINFFAILFFCFSSSVLQHLPGHSS